MRAVAEGGHNVAAMRHRGPQKGPVLPPVASPTPSSLFGLWQEASDGLNLPGLGSPCPAIGDGSQQALDGAGPLSRNARSNFERDIISQLQQDVKLSLLDRIEVDRGGGKGASWQAGTDVSKGSANRRPLQAAAGSVHDFPAQPLISNGASTLPSIASSGTSSTTAASMQPAAPSSPPSSTSRRPHPGRGGAQQVLENSSREALAEKQAPQPAFDYTAAETAAANAAADAAANSLRHVGNTGIASASAVSNEDSCGDKESVDQELEAKLAAALMEAEMEALEQTLSPHYVLVGAEKEVLEAALTIARMDVQQESPVMISTGADNKKTKKRNSLIVKMAGHGDALLSFVPRTMRRCIQHGLVSLEQWKVLLESPLNSWYDPVLSRFPACLVFADASGFTKLTETLARQPEGAEKIGMTLNNFFGPLIQLVQKHGGDIIKFSGDALTIIWAAAEPAPKDPRELARTRWSAAVDVARRKSVEMRKSTDGDSRRKSAEREKSLSFGDAVAALTADSQRRSSEKRSRRRSDEAKDGRKSVASSASEDDGGDPEKVTRRRRKSLTESLCQTKREVEIAASVAAVTHAAAFCLEVQREIHKFGRTPVPNCSLTMHIGVGFGDLALLQLGGLMGRWEYCIAGKALDQIAVAEPLAQSGETVFSPEARELAESGLAGRPQFEFEAVEDVPEGTPPGYMKLTSVRHSKTTDDTTERLKDEMNKEVLDWWMEKTEQINLDVRLLKRYVPSAVALRLACAPEAESVTYPEEMRRISVVFLSIAGLDPYSPEPNHAGLSGGRKTQLLMRLMQRSVYALEGSVNKFLVDDKGVLLLVCFGLPPLIHFTDDPIRSVLCAMRLRDTLKDEGLEGRVGVATGTCWCGVVGTEIRREYTVLGDTVNLAARLMGKAAVNQVLVDAKTRDISSSVLDFDTGEFHKLKGKVEPVRAFRFLHPRRGLKRHRKAVEQCLMSWTHWPAQVQLGKALDTFKHRSGVICISGPGGGGKTELAEIVRSWTSSRKWTLLAGQNMDPSGTFVLPRLSLQEAFQELVKFASKDPFWRSQAWDLLTTSVGHKAARHKRAVGMPSHAELYWMLNAMLRSSAGTQVASDLESWMPLLSLVVTQLAFAPRMVSAMAERDEQHAKNNRFAELCAHLMDAFSRQGSASGGTVLLLHIRRSSAFFQSKDQQEASAIRALAELCLRRRAEAQNGREARPLLLCVVSREMVVKDGSVGKIAAECGGCVEAEDLDADQTIAYMEHLIRLRCTASNKSKFSSQLEGSPAVSDSEEEDDQMLWSSEGMESLASLKSEPANPCVPPAHRDILAEYVFEMTGGNPLAVLVVFKQLCQRRTLRRDVDNPEFYRLEQACTDAAWLRQNVPVPESLVGMAFSNFERLDPREQMVLKAATTFEGPFGVTELSAALPKIQPGDLRTICTRLGSKTARAIRKATERETFFSPRASNGSFKTPMDNNEEKFQFYSGLLRHAASTLVLEAQRTEVRRNSALALSAMGLANLKDAAATAQRRSQQENQPNSGMGAIKECDGDSNESEDEMDEYQERRLSYH